MNLNVAKLYFNKKKEISLIKKKIKFFVTIRKNIEDIININRSYTYGRCKIHVRV